MTNFFPIYIQDFTALQSRTGPVQGQNRVFLVYFSHTGKPCFHYRDGFAVYDIEYLRSLWKIEWSPHLGEHQAPKNRLWEEGVGSGHSFEICMLGLLLRAFGGLLVGFCWAFGVLLQFEKWWQLTYLWWIIIFSGIDSWCGLKPILSISFNPVTILMCFEGL